MSRASNTKEGFLQLGKCYSRKQCQDPSHWRCPRKPASFLRLVDVVLVELCPVAALLRIRNPLSTYIPRRVSTKSHGRRVRTLQKGCHCLADSNERVKLKKGEICEGECLENVAHDNRI